MTVESYDFLLIGDTCTGQYNNDDNRKRLMVTIIKHLRRSHGLGDRANSSPSSSEQTSCAVYIIDTLVVADRSATTRRCYYRFEIDRNHFGSRELSCDVSFRAPVVANSSCRRIAPTATVVLLDPGRRPVALTASSGLVAEPPASARRHHVIRRSSSGLRPWR